MIRFYFFLNAGLYALLALWCTIKHGQTSSSSGYVELNHSGHSEYLVIYGGLQLGLAAFYAFLAMNPALYRTGIFFSLMLYAPIMIYRIVTVIRYSPVSTLTLSTGALEGVLLAAAVLIYFKK